MIYNFEANQQSTYRLYGGDLTCAMIVEAVMQEIGLCYELEPVDTGNGANREQEFLAINPKGHVPALVTPEGQVLHEAGAISLFLADLHLADHLAPKFDDKHRAIFLSKLFYVVNEIQPLMKMHFYPARYYPVTYTQDFEAHMQDRVLACWRLLNDFIAQQPGPFCLGQQFSLLDIYVAVWSAYGLQQQATIWQHCPAVKACYDAVLARPLCASILERQMTAIQDWR
jgi:glutathione S-transferase